jgi:transcriptional regulator with XRE-family HTH domain
MGHRIVKPSEQFLADLGERVRQVRWLRNMTLDGLANATDCSKAGLWAIEKGQSDPRASTVVRLARALDCSTEWILRGN